MDDILRVENLCKKYDDFSLNDLSFSLKRGYIMGFVGPNGSGKSTTIKLIMNLVKRDKGKIQLFGKDNIIHEKSIKNRIGFVYDQNHFYDELTLNGMKRIIAPFYKTWKDPLFYKFLKQFGLNPQSKIKSLSKGMKMKFSLSVALSHDAELIIMDEPTSGLDPIFRNEILDILSEIIEDGNCSVFFSSHITQDLERSADYITFINKGNLVFSSEKESILENYTIIKGPNDLLEKTLSLEKPVGFRRDKYGFTALMKSKNCTRHLDTEKIVIEQPCIDDIMLYTVRGNSNA